MSVILSVYRVGGVPHVTITHDAWDLLPGTPFHHSAPSPGDETSLEDLPGARKRVVYIVRECLIVI